MKSEISALMDGELEQGKTGDALEALNAEGDARDGWRRYHLIGDLMRDTHPLPAGFAARVADRIAREPTVLAPKRTQIQRMQAARMPLWALSAAASLAAVSLVGWVAFGPVDEAQLARTNPQPQVLAAQEGPQVAPPAAANDYLLAHQGYSPRNSLQGMAPYVRTVSGDMRGPRR
jgi:sigma-E factor negative regulatory protein RseA